MNEVKAITKKKILNGKADLRAKYWMKQLKIMDYTLWLNDTTECFKVWQ